MSDGSGNGILEGIEKLSEPVCKLLGMIENAVGKLWEPVHAQRMANADAKVAIIKANTAVDITDIQRRAVHRWLHEEEAAQRNIESIAEKAAKRIEESATCGDIHPDWVKKFFDACRGVSDTELQELWASLLSSEAQRPSTVSPATIDTLSRMQKQDLQYLKVLSWYSWRLFLGNGDPQRHLVYYPEVSRQAGHWDGGGSFLAHLQMLGVISWSDLSVILYPWAGDDIDVGYYGTWVRLKPRTGKTVLAGKLFLTHVGRDLLNLADCEPNEKVYTATMSHWRNNGVGTALLTKSKRPNPDKVNFTPPSA